MTNQEQYEMLWTANIGITVKDGVLEWMELFRGKTLMEKWRKNDDT